MKSHNALLSVIFVAALILAPLPLSIPASAAAPSGGTINPTATSPLNWTGSAVGGGALNDATGLVIRGEDLCQEGLSCDTYTLTVGGTPSDWAGKLVRVKIEWLLPATDYDLYVHKDSNNGPTIATSGNGATNPTGPLTSEEVTLDPVNSGTGVYTIHTVYYAATSADQYRGSVSVEAKPVVAATPTPTPSTEIAPRYTNYPAPPGLGESAGEPTLGVNWETGRVLFQASLQALRVTFDDTVSPTRSTWEDVSPADAIVSLDPMLHTDSDTVGSRTNRTFSSQLVGKASIMSYTDDDGTTWTPSQGSGINSGVDHQTIGSGPYAKNPDGTLKGGAVQRPGLNGQIYPNAVYYASQDIGLAEIARSDDGGQTFGVAVPMWTLVQCDGLHGHIKVAPDGTVYVPNKSCNGEQGVAVSEDNGTTWSIRTVPGSTAGDSDPSVGIAADGTVYFGYSDGDGHARVAVSHDRGLHWSTPYDVGASHSIQNSVFPATVAGDANRAAVFFLGSTTSGASGRATDVTFPGTWYGYIATTFDGGQTWVTANATPGDPVQRGVICTNGTTCPDGTRNLLDFNDMVVDAQGRVLAAYADGCVTDACKNGTDKNGDGRLDTRDNDGTDRAVIIRQSGGKRMFAAFDPPVNGVPAPPALDAAVATNGVNLTWTTPADDGGSPITGYKLYRGTEYITTDGNNFMSGNDTVIATFGPDVHSYFDPTPRTSSTFYRITALNANGESAKSRPAFPVVPESACTGDGITVFTDQTGDSLDQVPSHDIKSLHIGEPYFADGSNRVVFKLKMASMSGPLTPNTQWRIYFTGADSKGYFVDMRTDAIGTVGFKYGTYIHNADNTQGTSTTVGDADAGSKYDAQSGVITLVVSNSKIGNPHAGDKLSRIFVRVPVIAVVPDNANYANPSAGVAYTLVGNASCR